MVNPDKQPNARESRVRHAAAIIGDILHRFSRVDPNISEGQALSHQMKVEGYPAPNDISGIEKLPPNPHPNERQV